MCLLIVWFAVVGQVRVLRRMCPQVRQRNGVEDVHRRLRLLAAYCACGRSGKQASLANPRVARVLSNSYWRCVRFAGARRLRLLCRVFVTLLHAYARVLNAMTAVNCIAHFLRLCVVGWWVLVGVDRFSVFTADYRLRSRHWTTSERWTGCKRRVRLL